MRIAKSTPGQLDQVSARRGHSHLPISCENQVNVRNLALVFWDVFGRAALEGTKHDGPWNLLDWLDTVQLIDPFPQYFASVRSVSGGLGKICPGELNIYFHIVAQAMFWQVAQNQSKPGQMLMVAWMGSTESSLGTLGSLSTSVKPGSRPQRTRCHDMHDVHVNNPGWQCLIGSGVHWGILFGWEEIGTYLLAELSARGPNGEAWQTCQAHLTHATSIANLLPRGAAPLSSQSRQMAMHTAVAPSAVCRLAESNPLNGQAYRLFSRNCHLWAMILWTETELLSRVTMDIVELLEELVQECRSLRPRERRGWRESFYLSNAVELYGILVPNGLPERVRQVTCEVMTARNNQMGYAAEMAAFFGLTTLSDPNLREWLNEWQAFADDWGWAKWMACLCAILLPQMYSVAVSEETRCIIFRSKLEKLEPAFQQVRSVFPSHAPQLDQLRQPVLKFATEKAPQVFLDAMRCNSTLRNWYHYKLDRSCDRSPPDTPVPTLEADKWKALCMFFEKAYNDGGEFSVNFWFELHRSLVSATLSF